MSLLCQNCNCESKELFEVSSKKYRKRFRRDSTDIILVCKRCLDEEVERNDYLNKIIESDAERKLILARPGTGKTYTFQKYIEKFDKNDSIYIVTFINNLVNDLKIEIKNDNVKINTFHKFCYHLLKLIGKDYLYCANLTKIILEDIKILESRIIDEKKLKNDLNNYNSTNDIVSYFKISSYYKAVGNDDIFFELLKILKKIGKIDLRKNYKQIIIDEYQDFNLVESEIIKIISKNNKMLIAGDDDQALYTFKNSNPKYIRDIYKCSDFKVFKLPFCSRCTEVVVNSLRFFIEKVKAIGLLNERIEDKPYKCYFPDKYLDCKKYPKILWHKTSIRKGSYIGIEKILINNIKKYIEEDEIEKDKLNFLLLCPDERKNVCKIIKENVINELLKSKISIQEILKKEKETGLSIKDAYNILKKDNKNNLGWRMVIKNDPIDSWEKIIEESISNNNLICELLPSEYKEKHLELLNSSEEYVEELEIEKNTINLLSTNLYGSKGLSADHVFILFPQDGIFPKISNNPVEDEVYKFLVAMTRPKKSLHLITTYPHRSTFINMLPVENIE